METGSRPWLARTGRGGGSLPRTKSRPSSTSIRQRGRSISAGGREAAPVRRLKQAWCQGHRTVSPTRKPSERGAVVSAGRPYRKELIPHTRQQDRFGSGMTGEHGTIRERFDVDVLRQIGPAGDCSGFHARHPSTCRRAACRGSPPFAGGPRTQGQLSPLRLSAPGS
jgi:hypothetical protein